MTDPSGMAWMDDLVCAKEERDALADQLDRIREMLGIERDVDLVETLGRYLRQMEARSVVPADLTAKVLEYEHALEHVAECPLGGCPDCVTVARSALDRDNRADFTEMASGIDWEA